MTQDIHKERIAIIGAGMIGTSLAVLFTGNGFTVKILEPIKAGVEKALQRYKDYYQDLIEQGLVTENQYEKCASKLIFVDDFSDLSDANFVFECVVENKEIKHATYQKIEANCKNLRALASSTSAFAVDDLAEGVRDKEKICVAHPWNPPHLVPCVEVVQGKATSTETIDYIKSILGFCGRKVSLMKKDAKGFIGNRLQHALYREAVNMVEQGICEPEDIDKTLMYSFVPRYTSIGLFEHFDYAGLDMIKSIDDNLFPDLSNATKTQDLIQDLFDEGNLGVKTGKGVYDWTTRDMDEFRKMAAEPYWSFFNWHLPEAD